MSSNDTAGGAVPEHKMASKLLTKDEVAPVALGLKYAVHAHQAAARHVQGG